MDRILGGIIDDYTLFRIISGAIIILILIGVYLGIHISLIWKFLNKEETNSNEVISNKKGFYRSAIFIFIAGAFMVLHQFFEGLGENTPDNTTYELFELIALLGLVLFMYEWYKIFKKMKKGKIDINLYK
jgi:hypothetical protein